MTMKSIALFTGACSISLTTLGFLFKVLHWPGANVLLLLGIGIFALLFTPSFTRYLYLRNH